MSMIAGLSSVAASAPAPLQNHENAPKVKKPEQQPEEQPTRPERDEYVPGKREERCIGSTDKADREIERLKKQKEALEQQLNAATDESKIKDLESKLRQVENELARKDNDTYRRSHMEITGA